jgi:hypothetical protein
MRGAGPRCVLGDGIKLLPVLYNLETGVLCSDSRIVIASSYDLNGLLRDVLRWLAIVFFEGSRFASFISIILSPCPRSP